MAKKKTGMITDEVRELINEVARATASMAYIDGMGGEVNYFRAMESLLYNYKKLAALVADYEAYTHVELQGKSASIKSFSPSSGNAYRTQDDILISIHAPRAGGDNVGVRARGGHGISIHAPRAGGDRKSRPRRISGTTFQSTPPVRGATASDVILQAEQTARPPCGGRLLKFESLFGFSNNSCMVIRFRPHLAPYSKHITIDMNLKADFFGANLSAKACVLPLRIRGLYYPRVNMLFCSQSAQFCFDICCQGNKSAGCPYPCPLYHTSALAGCGTARHLTSIQIPSIALSVRS